jgi:hypothetical protein
MSRSHAEVISADAGDVTRAETTDVTSTEAAHVTSTEATHVTSAKAAHVAATKAAATMPAASATAASLRARGDKASGEQRGCQNHHPSCFHDLLHWNGRAFRHRIFARRRRVSTPTPRWTRRWEFSSALPSKLSVSHQLEYSALIASVSVARRKSAGIGDGVFED